MVKNIEGYHAASYGEWLAIAALNNTISKNKKPGLSPAKFCWCRLCRRVNTPTNAFNLTLLPQLENNIGNLFFIEPGLFSKSFIIYTTL